MSFLPRTFLDKPLFLGGNADFHEQLLSHRHEERLPLSEDNFFLEGFFDSNFYRFLRAFLPGFSQKNPQCLVLYFWEETAFWLFRVEEELQVSYGEFPQPYQALPWRNLVSESMTYLNHAERQFLPR